MSSNRTWLLVVLLATLTSAAFVLAGHQPLGADGDALQYDALGWNLALGRGFSLETSAPFTPTMFREPLYPAWLAILYRTIGHRPDLVPWFQIPLFAVTSVMTYFMGRWLFHEAVGWWAGVATACFPTLANYPTCLLTETLATALLMAAVGGLCLAWHRSRLFWWALAGAVLGGAVLCKAVMGPLALLAVVGVIAVRAQGRPLRHRMIRGVVLLAGCGLAVAPWILRNQRVFQIPQVSLRGDLILWMRANKVHDTPQQILQAGLYNFSEYLGQAVFPSASESPQEVVLRDSHLALERRRRLMADGLSQVEADHVMGQEAWRLIRRHPVRYLLQTPVEWIKLTAFSYLPALNHPRVVEWAARRPYGQAGLSAVRGVIRLLAYPLLVLAGIGMWRQRHRWRAWWPLGLAIVYFNGVHALLFGYGRQTVPVIPLYLLFAAAGLVAWRRSRVAVP
ncbi:MAG: glycosyltransferase family 39 protein [Candidatus Omnitrophica bacterium]|nr:glycosyltransferase family 39 protein [Candidatus Omnitrophota bacterium]